MFRELLFDLRHAFVKRVGRDVTMPHRASSILNQIDCLVAAIRRVFRGTACVIIYTKGLNLE